MKIENNVNSSDSGPTNEPLSQNNLIIQEEEVLPEIAPEPIPQAADLPPLVDKNIEYQEFDRSEIVFDVVTIDP